MVKLTKLWTAYFEDGGIINQPEDDRYSKHDDSKDHNPSSFQDILDSKSSVEIFELGGWVVNLKNGTFSTRDSQFAPETEPLTGRKLIYYRQMERQNIGGEWQEPTVNKYVIGYEGKNSKGKVEKKVIFING